jgi:hypothetical protein
MMTNIGRELIAIVGEYKNPPPTNLILFRSEMISSATPNLVSKELNIYGDIFMN